MKLHVDEIADHGKSDGRYYYKRSEFGTKNFIDDPESVVVEMENPNPDKDGRYLYFHEFHEERYSSDNLQLIQDLVNTGLSMYATLSDEAVRARNFFDETDIPGGYKVPVDGVANDHTVKEWNVREDVKELYSGDRRYYLVDHELDIVFQVTDPRQITVETVDGREIPITSYVDLGPSPGQHGRKPDRPEPGKPGDTEREFPDPNDPDLEDKLR